jgi:hypothetical protein
VVSELAPGAIDALRPEPDLHVQRRTSRPLSTGLVAAIVIPPVLYWAFVVHYGVNALFADDWTLVPLVNASMHGGLSWPALWGQHNESRILIPNLLFIAFGRLDHLNAKTIMYFSTFLFSAGYAFLLLAYRDYVGKFLGALPTLLVGLVWFSLSEFENTLWAFQLSWFIVDVCLLGLLYILSRRTKPALMLAGAVVVAVVASLSLLQGLILWPVGLLCLMWREQDRRQTRRQCGVWLVAALGTAAFYFDGYNSSASATGGGSISVALTHPIDLLAYIVTAVGNVFPSNWPPTRSSVDIHQVLGSALLAIGIFVFYRSWRERPGDRRVPLPAALILYAVLFDLTIAIGRSTAGASQAQSFRYTMANLLLLIGVALYGFSRLSIPTRRSHRRSRFGTSKISRIGIPIALVTVLVVQIGQATDVGLVGAHASQQIREEDDRLVLNLAQIPNPPANALVMQDVYTPGLAVVRPLVAEARRDELTVFAPGQDRPYVDAPSHS